MRHILKIIVCLVILINCGCSTSLRIRERNIIYDPKSRTFIPAQKKVPEAQRQLRVGEKLKFEIRWLGLVAGEATLWVKEIVNYEGREAYHIVSTVTSNKYISKIYQVKDEVHTYIDCENLHSLRFEKHLREGTYKCDEVMEYDQESHIGIHKSSGRIRAMTISPNAQDALSCLYSYRVADIEIGKPTFISVNADEKNWNLEVNAVEMQMVNVANQGIFDAFLVEPLAKFKGIFLRKGKLWIWFSSDARRLPLVVKTKIPIVGYIVVVVTNIE